MTVCNRITCDKCGTSADCMVGPRRTAKPVGWSRVDIRAKVAPRQADEKLAADLCGSCTAELRAFLGIEAGAGQAKRVAEDYGPHGPGGHI